MSWSSATSRRNTPRAITADVDIVETAKAAEFFSIDGVIVSGVATGSPTDPDEVQAVSDVVHVPTIIGSGITPENIVHYRGADAFIVGSSVKHDGLWSGRLDAARTRAVVEALS
jgi:predicted TIM-barrel enzyme